MGRCAFDVFHQIGDRQRRGQAYQQMRVILHAAEPGALTPSIPRRSPGVSPCLCSEPATAGLVAERCDALQARFQPPAYTEPAASPRARRNPKSPSR
jgi:hypothetical protein